LFLIIILFALQVHHKLHNILIFLLKLFTEIYHSKK
jgi:hypothetical protein